jgi:hypothetical protein
MGVTAPPLEELTFAIGPPLRPSLARLISSDDRDNVEAALTAYRERFAAVGLFWAQISKQCHTASQRDLPPLSGIIAT